ncbi:MAG TPA: hypothetical protein VGG64_20530 [Pirellulales bacterium]|jgi:hypothetical protein
MKRKPHRPGYAMLLVLAFLVMFFSVLALAYSQLGSLIRAETARAQTVTRDAGCVPALAQALELLETGYPPTNPFVCGVSINTSSGPQAFTVTFATQDVGNWSVQVAPTADNESPAPMPLLFTSTTPPS